MRAHVKAMLVGHKAGEGGARIYTFRATTEAIDRQGEIVTLDGWDFSSFEANPVILDSHNYYGIENIVGRAVPPLRMADGAWECDVVFNGTPRGQLAQQLVDEGNLRAVSVGFNSQKRERAPDGVMMHTQKELLEVSVVPVPANQEAVRVRGLIEKAGRALSAKNEALLLTASDAIDQVLQSLGIEDDPPPEGGDNQPTTEGASKGAPSALAADGEHVAEKTISDQALASLLAFATGKKET